MFDTVFVKVELPLTDELKSLNLDWKNVDFQTKSLENCLSTYTINEEGRLIAFNDAWWEENTLKRDPEPVDCHGKISLYDYIQNLEGYDWSIDFDAYFSYGKLDKVELTNVDKTSVKVREEREARWEQTRLKESSTLSYRLRRTLRKIPGWSKSLRVVGNAFRRAGEILYMAIVRWS